MGKTFFGWPVMSLRPLLNNPFGKLTSTRVWVKSRDLTRKMTPSLGSKAPMVHLIMVQESGSQLSSPSKAPPYGNWRLFLKYQNVNATFIWRVFWKTLIPLSLGEFFEKYCYHFQLASFFEKYCYHFHLASFLVLPVLVFETWLNIGRWRI